MTSKLDRESFIRLSEAEAEIIQLRRQLAAAEANWRNEIGIASDQIDRLSAQLAAAESQRDEWQACCLDAKAENERLFIGAANMGGIDGL